MHPGMIMVSGYFFESLSTSARYASGVWAMMEGNLFLYLKILLKGGTPYDRAILS